MNIHWLQHVPFEGLGLIEKWAQEKGHELSCTRLYKDETLPHQEGFDMLIVMGGPMGVYDDNVYGWLASEKEFLRETVKEEKPVLGICLGAQLLALVLGAEVVANKEKEIGWFSVFRHDNIPGGVAGIFPKKQHVFHWHGDTFELPEDSVRLCSSVACENQAFLYKNRILGLQFHLETTPESVELLAQHCGDELVDGKWIQTEAELQAVAEEQFENIHKILVNIMDYLALQVNREAKGGRL